MSHPGGIPGLGPQQTRMQFPAQAGQQQQQHLVVGPSGPSPNGGSSSFNTPTSSASSQFNNGLANSPAGQYSDPVKVRMATPPTGQNQFGQFSAGGPRVPLPPVSTPDGTVPGPPSVAPNLSSLQMQASAVPTSVSPATATTTQVVNHQQHMASLGKGMSSAERASQVRSSSNNMSSQMAAINAALKKV